MADPQILTGIGASAGVAVGPVVVVETSVVNVPSIAAPAEAFAAAVAEVTADLVVLAAAARERGRDADREALSEDESLSHAAP